MVVALLVVIGVLVVCWWIDAGDWREALDKAQEYNREYYATIQDERNKKAEVQGKLKRATAAVEAITFAVTKSSSELGIANVRASVAEERAKRAEMELSQFRERVRAEFKETVFNALTVSYTYLFGEPLGYLTHEQPTDTGDVDKYELRGAD